MINAVNHLRGQFYVEYLPQFSLLTFQNEVTWVYIQLATFPTNLSYAFEN